MKVYREIDPAYLEHFKAFAVNTARDSAKAVRKGGPGLVAAVYQMDNRCGGARGKLANARRIAAAMDALARRGVQLVACPEMCLQGYFTWVNGTADEARQAGRSLADEPGAGPAIRILRAAARRNRMVLAFGFSEKGSSRGGGRGKVYNSIGVIDADGSWLGSHRKNPLFPWDFEVKVFDEPPKAQRLSVFPTRYASIGVTNCFDGSFPETIRGLRSAGAQVLVWCNAAVGSPVTGNFDRVPTAAAYACANNMHVLCCNGAGENLSGTSSIAAAGGITMTVLPAAGESAGVASLNLASVANWDIYRTRLVLKPKCQKPRP